MAYPMGCSLGAMRAAMEMEATSHHQGQAPKQFAVRVMMTWCFIAGGWMAGTFVTWTQASSWARSCGMLVLKVLMPIATGIGEIDFLAM